MLLSAVAAQMFIGASAVFAQHPTMDKLSFIRKGSGQNIYYEVKAASNVVSGHIVIPETYDGSPVTTVAWMGFDGCSNMTGVTIPAKVRKVDGNAFRGCTNLRTITFGGSNTSADWTNSFPGAADLKVKYGNGGAGTYTREGSNTWTMQGGYYAPPPPQPTQTTQYNGGGRRHGGNVSLNGIWTRNDGTQITISENGQSITITDGAGRFTRMFMER